MLVISLLISKDPEKEAANSGNLENDFCLTGLNNLIRQILVKHTNPIKKQKTLNDKLNLTKNFLFWVNRFANRKAQAKSKKITS